MNFAIVRFTDEEDAPGIISTNWISENKNICLFPNVKSEDKKNRLLLARQCPEENWLKCPIRILREFYTYQDARTHLSQAEETSSLESIIDETPKCRSRKRKKIILPGEDLSSSEDEIPIKSVSKIQSLPYPLPPASSKHSTPVKTPNRTSPMLTSQSHCTSSSSESSTLTPQPQLHVSNLKRPSSSSFNEALNKVTESSSDIQQLRLNQAMIWKVLNEFTAVAQRLESKIDTLLAQQRQSLTHNQSTEQVEDAEDMNLIASLPLQSEDDFSNLNVKLVEKSSFKQKLIRILMTTGGRDVKAVATNILRRLLTDNLAEGYSLTGKPVKNGPVKKCFAKTAVFSLITDVCFRTYKDAKESDLREAVSDWLMQAKFRRTRRESRNKPSTSTDRN